MVRRLIRSDGTGADDRGRGQPGDGLRRERSGSDREDPPGCAGASRGSCAGGGAGSHRRARAAGDVRAARRAELREQELLQQQHGANGKDRGERLVVLLEVLLEETASLAVADVAASRRAQLDETLGDFAELEAHLVAAQLACLGGLGERDPGTHEQRLHRRHRGLHRIGDLVVGQGIDLSQEQGGALGLGQLAHVAEKLTEALAPENTVAC